MREFRAGAQIASSFLIRLASPEASVGSCSSRRFWDALLCRNWWLLYAFRRVILPLPVILNRFAAVLFVLSFDIFFGTFS